MHREKHCSHMFAMSTGANTRRTFTLAFLYAAGIGELDINYIRDTLPHLGTALATYENTVTNSSYSDVVDES